MADAARPLDLAELRVAGEDLLAEPFPGNAPIPAATVQTVPPEWTKRCTPNLPMGVHGLHNWWYRCLQRAGIVAAGVTSGARMHEARHTAGQRVLDATGDLKAVQKLLGHESIQTTGDIYTDWDVEQLAESQIEAVQDD
jgi:integrase